MTLDINEKVKIVARKPPDDSSLEAMRIERDAWKGEHNKVLEDIARYMERELGYHVTEEQLGKVYHANRNNCLPIAILCDEHIDRSGALLGRVRDYKEI